MEEEQPQPEQMSQYTQEINEMLRQYRWLISDKKHWRKFEMAVDQALLGIANTSGDTN